MAHDEETVRVQITARTRSGRYVATLAARLEEVIDLGSDLRVRATPKKRGGHINVEGEVARERLPGGTRPHEAILARIADDGYLAAELDEGRRSRRRPRLPLDRRLRRIRRYRLPSRPRGRVRIPGYCSECHRVKQVRVSNAGMIKLAQRGVAEGICADCEDAQAPTPRDTRRRGNR